MSLTLRWTLRAEQEYQSLKAKAQIAVDGRKRKGQTKSSKAEGLFKQVNKAIRLLRENP